MSILAEAPPEAPPESPEAPPRRDRGHAAALANMKGGVGKTTTALMLADALAAAGRTVAVVDLDPQASASLALAGPYDLAAIVGAGRTLDAFLRRRLVDRKRSDVLDMVERGVTRTYDAALEALPVSLLACSGELRSVERQAVRALSRKGDWDHVEREVHALFRDEVLGPLRDAFDWVLLDCAPGLGLLATAALAEADAIVVATVPEPLSVHGLDAFLAAAADREGAGMPGPAALPKILATCVAPDGEAHARTIEHLRAAGSAPGATFGVFEAVVARSANLSATALFENLPIGYETKYTQAQRAALLTLANEIEEGVRARA